MPITDDIAVLTSENVRLTYTLAGLGSRLAAFLADTAIIFFCALGLTYLFFTVGMSVRDLESLSSGTISFLVGIYIAALFLLIWGYYFFFEWINWGQSPGKQLLGIRVTMADGAPADLTACAVRNVIRIIDMLLAAVGVTPFVLIFTPRFQRLGDLAAGTVVVKKRALFFDDVLTAARAADRSTTALASEAPALAIQLKVTEAERDLIERFLARREALPESVRLKLSRDLAARIRAQIPGDAASDLTDEALIEAVHAQASRLT
jgi:uncharacterized RDD family membrane protein YckC